MVKIICLLFGSFVILQALGTSAHEAGCNGDPNAESGCDTCNTNCENYDIEQKNCKTRPCRPGECKCIDGFVKNSKGVCVPYEECPPACGKHEEYSACNGHCQKTCRNKYPICVKVCIPGCVCQPGYARDAKTTECIKEDQCTSSCGRNEVYSPCRGHCQKTCENKNPVCILICRPGCICRPNYVRDIRSNKCIKENQCPPLCGINEVYARCSGHCGNTGGNLNQKCTAVGRPGCICRPNYIRDLKTKKCVKKNRCTANIKCEVNEVTTKCLPGCPEDTCVRAGKKKSVCNTLLPVPCKAGCICRENYFRNANGVCTSAADCLKCRKPNEVFGCRRPCDDKKCTTITIPCNFYDRTCSKKCYCRNDYARNRWGICIPISKCIVRCPVNEEYICVLACPPKLCRTRFVEFRCRADQVCVYRCECKAGYLRNNKGRCVKRNRCDGCNGLYAETSCETGCDTCNITCDNYDIEPKICAKRPCRPGECKCMDGFVKNSKGLCIPYDKCPPACGKHEEYSACNGHCQKTCKSTNPICIKVCKPGCVCQLGFVRDAKTNECIKLNQCPQLQCGVYEVPTKCLPGCPEDTCERAGKKKYVCNTLLPVPCKAGCICGENYFRNADGVCTSAADCLKCRKPNEVFGCRRPCDDKKCSTLTIPCNSFYRKCTKQCSCRNGYARNRWGLCIPISKCPTVRCPVNEEYRCVMGCPPQICRTRFVKIRCRRDQVCVSRCECKAGYLRNNKGRCVKSNRCEKSNCGNNEVFARHITCPPKTCASMIERIICPKPNPCRDQCDCKDNYLRNSDGECIPSEQCIPSLSKPNIDDATPPNETYETSEPDTGDALSPPDDDIIDDEDELDD